MKKERVFDRSLKKYEEPARERALLALKDDLGKGDITTNALIKKPIHTKAFVIAKSPGILCGLLEAKEILKGLNVTGNKKEGEKIRRGDVLLTISGDARKMLQKGRAALNYIQILSGIATATKKLTKKYKGRICALRKTHPCMSHGEKRAVQVGGGFTHRIGLFDGILIKDNHIAAISIELFGRKFTEKKKTTAIRKAIRRAAMYRKKEKLNCPIEIEVESREQAMAAAGMKRKTDAPDAIMIDNKTPKEVAPIVEAIRKVDRSILIEASGGITPKNIGKYIEAGVDVVSSSYLTLRSKPLDASLVIKGYK